MTVELKLVTEVEKHPCLYNYNLSEYSRKDLTEKAWGEVATKTELSVNDCKEKWRNIRSSFLRSLRTTPGGCKLKKKPYYLKDYLQFIVPYTKSLNSAEKSGNIPQPDTEQSSISDDLEVTVNDNLYEGSQNVVDHNIPNEINPSISPFESTTTEPQLDISTTVDRRRKHPILEVEKAFIDYLKSKTKRFRSEETVHQHCRRDLINMDDNPMRYFLMSLLPEFETMTEDQIRAFKIRVMVLIDEIKTNYAALRRTPHYSTIPIAMSPGSSHNPSFEDSSSYSQSSPTVDQQVTDTKLQNVTATQ